MNEEPILFSNNSQQIGILNHGYNNPSTCIILCNAGNIHRVGPNLLNVQLARVLAKLNFASFRFDFSPLGDSISATPSKRHNDTAKISELKTVINLLREKQFVDFIFIGICSGASVGFLSLQHIPDIKTCILVNGEFLNGDIMDPNTIDSIYQIAKSKINKRYYKKVLFKKNKWKRLLTGKSNIFELMKTFLFKKRNPQIISPKPKQTYFHTLLQNYVNNNINIYFLFSEGSIALDIYNILCLKSFNTINKNNSLKLDYLYNTDHIFTPKWSQESLINKITTYLLEITNNNRKQFNSGDNNELK